MYTPRISAIAAIGKNRELGKNNNLIWRISGDLKRVKELTTGHTLIMGRKTFEAIGKPLPNRTTIIVSRSLGDVLGCIVCTSVEEALVRACEIEAEEVFVFGGAQVYTEMLPDITRLYLTLIDAEDADADAVFPDYHEFTRVISEEKHHEHTPPYTYRTLER